MPIQRVHLHIKYIERSDELYITKDITKYVYSRLSMHDDERGQPSSKDGVLQIYIVTPEFGSETKKSGNKIKNKNRKKRGK